MLKKLTLTIVLILSILCLGGCNMEEENRLMIEEDDFYENFTIFVENSMPVPLDEDIEITIDDGSKFIMITGGITGNTSYEGNKAIIDKHFHFLSLEFIFKKGKKDFKCSYDYKIQYKNKNYIKIII